jgi:3-oxoacyl-[acyl-carrier protein] reductase
VGQVTAAELDAQLAVNFVAPYLLAQRVGKHMHDRRSGAILFLASTLSERPAPLTSAYGASKAALVNTTRAFALELSPHVRVNALAPGVVDTDMVRVPRMRGLRDGDAPQESVANELETLRKLHPLGRLGRVDEIASAALFVLDASWVTGSVLTIDGGLSLA